MRYKLSLTGVALLLSANGWALPAPAGAAYYSVETIDVIAEGASYGPYPSAMSEDGTFIGTYSMKASLSIDMDIGLPFTFNRDCQYDAVFCELAFYGSETFGDLSYDNASQAWRNAQSNAKNVDYTSYFMGNTLLNGFDEAQTPYPASVNNSDVKITDVTDSLATNRFIVGYSSAPYDVSNQRDFVRRAFIKYQGSDFVTSLLPEFSTNGGFSSAYKIKQVTYSNGETKTLVVGASSVSYAQDTAEYFQNCYFSAENDQILTTNELVNCPGFDTQAWAWEVIDNAGTVNVSSSADVDLSGFSLASNWLDDNADNNDSNATYSASALDINAVGIAVGVSTFEYSDAEQGGRQRAIIMTPDADGAYGAPTELTDAARDIESEGDQGDTLYNTWAIAITDTNTVIGNREYNVSKSVNKPTEFFVYDIDGDSIRFPLQDIKVQSTKQRLNGNSSAKKGADSQVYDINESGFIVGKADDYDQTHSVNGGSPRAQSAFLYNNNTDQSWFLNDLICSLNAGAVTSPRYRIRSATVINDAGQVLAEGQTYLTDQDYVNRANGTEVMLKLTPTAGMTPDDSPNCWDSELLKSIDSSYERSGAASLWLWIFALPVLLVRRLIK
ncbi:hypothetical protein Ping_2280 [Psychromonas ingrahamii 37]|uniref:DUF3466 family protein n=1 Tax=Psychromonas ingrahamii (strain DSM 17664 / CCUG 51855 / 37) TaxID=357804 RepID=A1SX06_PSYIN|nr:DUF3466 family protein [Psychromonas ingrahamii]ABM04021.1 hypothetical protein Ping_2280 [Psychromonas ingrahamii 37]